MRIWWRNIAPLANAGFDVIVPDLRGFGESGPAPDDFYDVVAQARDILVLVREELGLAHVVTCGGDLGGVVAQELAARFEGFVVRQVLFNTIPPVGLGAAYEAAGVASTPDRKTRQAADYFYRQANYADVLAAELDTPDKRRRYIASFYGSRFWAAPGSFTREDVDRMTEPFADADRFRASIANYEYAGGPRQAPEPPRLLEPNPTPTLILYGPEDHVIVSDFPQRMEAAFPNRAGPFVVQGAGHFLQWERADVLNGALRWLCLP